MKTCRVLRSKSSTVSGNGMHGIMRVRRLPNTDTGKGDAVDKQRWP